MGVRSPIEEPRADPFRRPDCVDVRDGEVLRARQGFQNASAMVLLYEL